MFYEYIMDVVVQTVLITFFVLSMLLLLEYLNVRTSGKSNSFVQRHPDLQIFISSLMGLMPGCVGSFAVVSMYTHNVVGFGALMANLIATTGEDGWLMLGMMPGKALLIFGVLFLLSVAVGYIVNFVYNHNSTLGHGGHFVLHPSHDAASSHSLHGKLSDNFRHLSVHRIVLMASLVVFLVLVFCGFLDDHHSHGADEPVHDEEGFNLVSFTFEVLALLSLVVVATVNDHFLEDHLFHHVIGKHFVKICLFTFIALSVLFVLTNVWNVQGWVEQFSHGQVYIFCLIAAIAVGLLPISGPHWIFVSLYLSGTMPLGALLANSIVQDGHGAMPLLAESKRDFLVVKGIKVIAALIAGLAVWCLKLD